MSRPHSIRHPRLKLLALMALFSLPLLVAWIMVSWRIGIPDERTAHGDLVPDIPTLAEWPLTETVPDHVHGDWVLAFDCAERCEALADQWWRLHRALGREAPRVSRLRIGGDTAALPGEAVAHWAVAPGWREADRLWVLDPQGLPVLGYGADADARDVLDDINRLLRMNPEVTRRDERELARR
ncbi:hypothetical protein [Halomonas campaniensis]|uniref:hypothetical protein n=1 Tax=Halomonas campaniensis TaxID=213554 RepID=UPI003562A310